MVCKETVGIYLSITLLILALSACTQSQSTIGQSQAATKIISVKPLLSNESFQVFSDNQNKDTLRVTVTGETLLSGQVNFQITNHQGKTIYWDTFPASNLLSHTGLINPESDKKTVQNQIYNFFTATHFASPSRVNPDTFSVENPTKIAWKQLSLDPKSRSFSYPIGKNKFSSIVFSEALQKVICLK